MIEIFLTSETLKTAPIAGGNKKDATEIATLFAAARAPPGFKKAGLLEEQEKMCKEKKNKEMCPRRSKISGTPLGLVSREKSVPLIGHEYISQKI